MAVIRLTTKIIPTELGNYTAEIRYKGKLLWTNCYGKHGYAAAAIRRNYDWCLKKAQEEEKANQKLLKKPSQ